MSWPARYPGRCGACGEHFEEGALVTWGEGATVVEEGCAGASVNSLLAMDQKEARARACPKCWLIHPKGKVDCE